MIHRSAFRLSLFLALVVLLANLSPAQINLQNAFPNLTFSNPVALAAPPDSSNRLFVVTQSGIIYVMPNRSSAETAKVFLDIHSKVVSGGEMGLLSIAFHPNYVSNGFFYVYYTVNNNVSGFPYASVVSRFTVSAANPDSAVASSEVVFMRINEPFNNHKGGQLAFSPRDGYLYLGLGDGGSEDDPQGNGQKMTTLLAKMLRIDVNAPSGSLQYTIPSDNPFLADTSTGVKGEIFAVGVRNPWRYSFDHLTGALWAGDVGQDLWEEIDTISIGKNYGWSLMEADNCYNPSSGCDTAGLTMPLVEYSHDSGCAVMGGYVYRGQSIPELYGYYVYGDYCNGYIWMMDSRAPSLATNYHLLSSGLNISAFGVDQYQELYVVSYGDGTIRKFISSTPHAPALLLPAKAQKNVPLSPTLTWSNPVNSIAFHFQVALDSLFHAVVVNDSTAGDTTFQVGPLAYSTRYYWRVNASSSGGTSAYSAVSNFRTSDSSAPPSPALIAPLTGATNEPSLLHLLWGSVANAEQYQCELSLDSTFASVALNDSAATDTTAATGSLIGDTVYYWRVRAANELGQGSYSSVWSFRTSIYSFARTLNQNWNLVSLPVLVSNPTASVVYPNAASPAYGYTGGAGYATSDSLQLLTGYWLKFADTTTVAIAGTQLYGDSAGVAVGWNLIGAISVPVVATSIESNPPGLVVSQFFGYVKGYTTSDSILPGRAYWVKSGESGTLYLSGGSSTLIKSRRKAGSVGPIFIQPTSELPPGPPTADGKISAAPIPKAFALSQNYPNPFNPVTSIQYDLPRAVHVLITLYNVLGQRMETLVDEDESAGYKSIQINASNFASGVYFYTIQAGDFFAVKKMLLAK
jgi:glucose/arabinose dehydrogenase